MTKGELYFMALKGAKAKEELTQELLNYFGDKAFKYEKEIRVNLMEDGQPVQIKLSLTAAKVAVEKKGETALPGEGVVVDSQAAPAMTFGTNMEEAKGSPVPPTAEEKQSISELLAKLGL